MAAISFIMSAMRRLVSSDPDPLAPSGWMERIGYNSKRVRETLQFDSTVRQLKTQYQLDIYLQPPLSSGEETTSTAQWEFIVEGLTLLVYLHKSSNTTTNTAAAVETENLLSVSDQKTLRSLSQFLSLLGLYPFLDQGVGLTLTSCSSKTSIIKRTDLSHAVRALYLYRSLCIILECFSNQPLAAVLLPILLSNVLAGLIQIIYKPTDDVSTCRLSQKEKEWCRDQLKRLMSNLPHPVIVRELLTLQGVASKRRRPSGDKEKVGEDLSWLSQACGELLSRLLMEENGVQSVLRGIFETSTGSVNLTRESVTETSENWQKCQAIGQILSSCPLQVNSIEQYYSVVCPQILSLIHLPADRVGRQFLRVAVCTLTLMLSKQEQLTMKYLIVPLLLPLRQLTGDSKCADFAHIPASLEECLTDLNRILSVIESTSPLMVMLTSYLPLLFDIWQVMRIRQESILNARVKEVLLAILKPCDSSTQLALFKHILYQETGVDFKCLSSDLQLVLTANGELTVKRDSVKSFTSELMVEIGGCISELIEGEPKYANISSCLFVHCLNHMSSLLASECGLGEPIERANNIPQQNNGKCSSVLLEWEQDSVSSEKLKFSNALVLYTIALLCETMNNESLKNLDIPTTLKSLTLIIKCHSKHCTKGIAVKEREESSPDDLTGGHVTLSIAFGLLSAILACNEPVDHSLRPVLTDLLPYLECIARCHSDEELSTLAEDLRICISTLGSVWSVKMREKATNITGDTKRQKDAEIVSEPVTKSLIEEIPPKETGAAEMSSYSQALNDIQDSLLPVKGHGLKQLGSLIRERDSETLTHTEQIVDILTSHINHSDSYIYLPAIQGLVALAGVKPSLTIPLLCQEYGQLSHESKDEETGVYFSGKESDGCQRKAKRSLECRVKLGEALVRVARECGELLPHFSQSILSAVLCNIRDSEALIRASALSNLADVCVNLKWSFTPIENEVIECLEQILQYDSDSAIKRGAITVIKQLFKGLGTDLDKVLHGESLLKLYRLLKDTEAKDSDPLTQTHAQAALGELDHIMRQLLFPAQTLTKKISVLDHMI